MIRTQLTGHMTFKRIELGDQFFESNFSQNVLKVLQGANRLACCSASTLTYRLMAEKHMEPKRCIHLKVFWVLLFSECS